MKYPLLMISALLISACGGGGDGNGQTAAPIDSPSAPSPKFVLHFTDGDDGDDDLASFALMREGRVFVSGSVADRQIVIDPNVLPVGLSSTDNAQLTLKAKSGQILKQATPLRAYRGFHSGTFVYLLHPNDVDPGVSRTDASHYYFPTTAAALPQSGRATYRGHAIGAKHDDIADFSYHLDFGRKRGAGEIAANPHHSHLTLRETALKPFNEDGNSGFKLDGDVALAHSASQARAGGYELVVSGPKAEELSGTADFGKHETGLVDKYLGLHGTRGEITP